MRPSRTPPRVLPPGNAAGTTEADLQTRFTQSMAGHGRDCHAGHDDHQPVGLGDSQVVTVNIAVPYSEV